MLALVFEGILPSSEDSLPLTLWTAEQQLTSRLAKSMRQSFFLFKNVLDEAVAYVTRSHSPRTF
jgi:hypothetical protein